ncbi:hypothetical protein SDC9_82426 [bioreactor metagenome]|uniref:Uncharacterized protein n=1 Tax=bioreactor metagenome TaxID=1076179 RepID=A0A644Z4W0_9ZZZZ
MPHLNKVLIDVTSHPHRGRIGVVIFGMLLLQFGQLLHQCIKIEIGNGGVRQHVVIVIMLMQLPA